MLSFLLECEAQSDASSLRSGRSDTDAKLDGKRKETGMFSLQNYETELELTTDGEGEDESKEYAIRNGENYFDMKTDGKETESEEILPQNNETETHVERDGSVHRSKRSWWRFKDLLERYKCYRRNHICTLTCYGRNGRNFRCKCTCRRIQSKYNIFAWTYY